ncbi:protein kinase domain-containing protein [Actinophytocola sp. KF-1]
MTDPDAELRAWAPKPGDPTTPGPRLPGYSDFRLVAEGGEGTVYRARQDGLDRFVAVKVINVEDPARLARFRRELEITVRLGRQHPHIVTVIDTGTTPDGRPCIVMEYHDRGSLQDRLRAHGPLPAGDVVAAGIAVADALAFAHAQGYLHRDVKPQNILVLPTSYVLADFGIARMADGAMTSSLQLVSYWHAAPQMLDGAEPSPADDLWSLGSTLFTLLDGAPPFATDDDTMLSYLARVRTADPRPLRRADVPPELAAILTRCLSKRREDRFPDAAALRAALSAVETGTRGWTPSVPVAELPDFGPRPAAPLPEIPPDDEDPTSRDLTVAGPGSELAGLTVRLPDAPPAVVPPPAVAPSAPADEPAPRRKGRTGLVLGIAAVVAGVTAGVAATVLSGRDETGARPPATTTTPATTATTTTTTTTTTPTTTPTTPPTASAPVTGSDPAFAPVLRPLADRGDSVTLTWTDPTDGGAEFVVVDATGEQGQALVQLPSGTTTHTVEGLDPAADRYCFVVLAIGLDDPATDRGVSERRCTDR